jgi:hypothetical protein
LGVRQVLAKEEIDLAANGSASIDEFQWLQKRRNTVQRAQWPFWLSSDQLPHHNGCDAGSDRSFDNGFPILVKLSEVQVAV